MKASEIPLIEVEYLANNHHDWRIRDLAQAELDRRGEKAVEPKGDEKCWLCKKRSPTKLCGICASKLQGEITLSQSEPAPVVIEPWVKPNGYNEMAVLQLQRRVEALEQWKQRDDALLQFALTHTPEETVAETKRTFDAVNKLNGRTK